MTGLICNTTSNESRGSLKPSKRERNCGFTMLRCWAFLLAITAAAAQPAQPEAAVLDVRRSPAAKVHGVPIQAVTLKEGFWADRRRQNTEVSIPTLHKEFEDRGIFDNFRRLAGKKVARRGPLYTDSDVYKWMEAIAFEMQSGEMRNRQLLEDAIPVVLAAQGPDGYLNTYYSMERADQRHTNMRGGHELYCLGHYLQAGIAYYRATGKRDLMDSGIRFVRYFQGRFGPGKEPIYGGHPEIELALIELYRTTGDRSFLDFAGYLLNSDPRLKLSDRDLSYMNTGKPFTSRTQMEGHAVRAGYAISGATDYYLETGDPRYRQTLDRLWEDLVFRKMYITGGTGSRSSGEAFGEPYELPNQLAYTESCAAIASYFWNWRMLAATGDAKYADVLERALYNGINSGLSLSGNLYCYRNPLELTGNPEDRIRNPWYDTTCCPPNLERVLASLPGYMYGTSKEGLYVHLFHSSELAWKLEDGTPIRIVQSTQYPWQGRVTLTLEPAGTTEFTLFLRIPLWSRRTAIRVNDAAVDSPAAGSYHPLRRAWRKGDTVSIDFDMAPRLTLADRRVRDNIGKAAVERGPLVYCMEGLDQAPGVDLADVSLDLREEPQVREEVRKDLLGGVIVLRHMAIMPARQPQGLYQDLDLGRRRQGRPIEVRLVPYYTFANRAATPMQVWIPFVD